MPNQITQALEALTKAAEEIEGLRVDWITSVSASAIIRKHIAALSSAAPSAAEPVAVTDDMVTRFLGWKLPQDFAPDCGISFTPPRHPNGWPIGTNLLNATQARQMIAHVLAAAPSSQSASELGVTQAARDVLAERQRQISTEGYTPEHDDEHGAEEFGRAASVYANSHVYDVIGASYMGWPWDEAWYKPTTQRRNFVKAAALLLAGIECIDRATLPAVQPEAETSATASVAGLSGDAEREAFEKWAKAHLSLTNENFKREEDGTYSYVKAWTGWKVWRALRTPTFQRLDERSGLDLFAEASTWSRRTGNGITQETADLLGWLTGAVQCHIERIASQADAPVAEPVAWAVYWGLPPTRKNSVHFERTTAEGVAARIKSNTEIRPLVHPLAPEEAKDAARKPLTEAQIKSLYHSNTWWELGNYPFTWGAASAVIRATERAHGITDAAPPQGEGA